MQKFRISGWLLFGLMTGLVLSLGCRGGAGTSRTLSSTDPASNYLLLKQALTGDSAVSWWWDMRGKWSPTMKLWVVSAGPPERPTVLRLSPEREGEPEVTLHLDAGYEQATRWEVPQVGDEVLFDGRPQILNVWPFHLTLERARVWPVGWPHTVTVRGLHGEASASGEVAQVPKTAQPM